MIVTVLICDKFSINFFYRYLFFAASQVYTPGYAWMYPFKVLSLVSKKNLFTVPVKSKLDVTQLDSVLNPQKFLVWI